MTCLADMKTILEETGLLTVPRMVRTTDASGNFLLQNVPTGPQIVFVDGASASTASEKGKGDSNCLDCQARSR